LKLKNLALRVLVAIFGIPLILFTIYKGGYPFLTLVLIITIVSQYEFYKLAEKKNLSPLKYIGILIGVLITLIFFYQGISNLWIVLFSGIIIILLTELFRNKPNATLNVATTISGILYPTTLFSFLILIREFPNSVNVPYKFGGLWVITIIVTIWICDTAAYFVGSAIGKYKLFQRVSPNKTIEGGIAGFVFSFITVYIFHLLYPNVFSLTHYLIIGGIIGITSQVGDLIESLVKRDIGVKDSSAILPGHGGFFDRFDSPTFTAPIMYFYIVIIVF
jgi:phosphatidate cytidylyltransferase